MAYSETRVTDKGRTVFDIFTARGERIAVICDADNAAAAVAAETAFEDTPRRVVLPRTPRPGTKTVPVPSVPGAVVSWSDEGQEYTGTVYAVEYPPGAMRSSHVLRVSDHETGEMHAVYAHQVLFQRAWELDTAVHAEFVRSQFAATAQEA